MRHLTKVSLPLILIFILCASAAPAAKTDYFTAEELDLIRDAQGLALRLPAFFKLAKRRLVVLGVLNLTDKEKEKERKEEERRIKEQQRQTGEKPRTPTKPPEDPMAYLRDFTRSELLRGYSQVIDEVMSNIDDAYTNKLDVRDSLEDLERFLAETVPLLETFPPGTDSERAALRDALDKAKDSQNSVKEALSVVPKTEKKRKP